MIDTIVVLAMFKARASNHGWGRWERRNRMLVLATLALEEHVLADRGNRGSGVLGGDGRVLGALALVFALALSCSGDPAAPTRLVVPVPTTVTVTPSSASLSALRESVKLTATVRDSDGNAMAGAAVNWASSAAVVATVSATGLVTAAGNGAATITATAGSTSGSATVTVSQEVTAVAVRPAADTVIAGDTLRLVAEAADANGHVVAGTEFNWASGDTLVAVVDKAGLVTGIGLGEAEVTATAAGFTGRVEVTVVLLNGVVLPGTVWVSADIITEADPSALDSLVYVGRGMRGFFDPFESRWRDDLEVFLFEAHFDGGATMEVQAHPAYGQADSALVAARLYLPPIGRLPRMLIDGGREVELSPEPNYGAGGNGCGKLYHWGDGHLSETGFLEEVALHEGGHAVLDDCGWDGCRIDCAGLARSLSAEWRAAQAADSLFITAYARDNPNREDVAETLWAWFVSRCVPDRLPPEYKRRIDAGIPHRLAYFDRLGLDMRPWQC